MNILEDYEIISVLGEGTFGVVKLGKDNITGEKVAIKILEKKKIINKDDEIRVEREIDILKRVHHINVISMKEIKKDEDNIYLIMEFCEKGELFNHIVEEQKLEEIEAAYFYYQLINGLECIHFNGVVHRDLKPENLLISNDYILKIIDFGLSNYFDKIHYLSTPCGSPCYASPEMVSGKRYNGFLIDIWSTGIILFAMLCGYLPFEDPDNEILFKKIYQCDVEYPDDLTDDSIDLMNRILVNNPEERITIPEIKHHPFYLKGKQKFESLHPDLVKEVEKDYSHMKKNKKNNNIKIEENENKIIEDNKDENENENERNEEKKDNKDNKENEDIRLSNEKQKKQKVMNHSYDDIIKHTPKEEIIINNENNKDKNKDKDKDQDKDQDKEKNKEIVITDKEKDSDLKKEKEKEKEETNVEKIIEKKEEICEDIHNEKANDNDSNNLIKKEKEKENENESNKKEEDIVNILDNQNNNNNNNEIEVEINSPQKDSSENKDNNNNIISQDLNLNTDKIDKNNEISNNNNNNELKKINIDEEVEKIEKQIKELEKKNKENKNKGNKNNSVLIKPSNLNTITYTSKNKSTIETNNTNNTNNSNLMKKIKPQNNHKNKRKVRKEIIMNNNNNNSNMQTLKENVDMNNLEKKNNTINHIISKEKEKRQNKNNDKHHSILNNNNNNIIIDSKNSIAVNKTDILELKRRNYTKREKNKNTNIIVNTILEKNKTVMGTMNPKNEKKTKNNSKNIKIYIEGNDKPHSHNLHNFNTTNILIKEPKYVKINLNEPKIKSIMQKKINERKISNVKNKIHPTKNMNYIRDKINESLKNKTIPKNKTPSSLLNKKNEIKFNKNPLTQPMNVTHTNNINHNNNNKNIYINSLNNYNLSEKNIIIKIDKKFNSAKNDNTIKLNPLNNIKNNANNINVNVNVKSNPSPQPEKRQKVISIKKNNNINNPIYNINNNYKYNYNNKLLDQIYNKENQNTINTKIDNPLSLNMYNINNKFYTDTIPTMSNSVEKINKININTINNVNSQNKKRFKKIHSINNNNIKINNYDIENNTNHSQRNTSIKKIIDSHMKNNSQINKNFKNNIYNNKYNRSEYNQKTYENLNINNICQSKENFARKLNEQDTLLSDITYKRQFMTEAGTFNTVNSIEPSPLYIKIKNDQILKNSENEDIIKKKIFTDRKEYIINHQKNTSNLLYSNKTIMPQKINLNTNVLLNSKTQILESPINKNKKRKINEPIKYDIESRKNNRNYVSSGKQLDSLFNNTRLPSQNLNLFRQEYLNTNPNILNADLKRTLGLYSNSVENNRISDYANTLPMNNYEIPFKLYNTNYNLISNKMKNFNKVNLPGRINMHYLSSNSSYDDYKDSHMKAKYYYNINRINIKNLGHTNNRLIKKGVIDDSKGNINSQYNYRIPMHISSNLYDNNKRTKYLSNYNLNDNNKTVNKIHEFNRTQDLYYNHKINNNITANNINRNLNNVILNNKNNRISLPNNEQNIKKSLLEPKSSNEDNIYHNVLYNRYNNNNNIYQTIINNYNSRKPNNQVVKNNRTGDILKILSSAKDRYILQKSLKKIPHEIKNLKINNMSNDFNNEIPQYYFTNNNTLDNIDYYPNNVNKLSTERLMKNIERIGKTVEHSGKGINNKYTDRNFNYNSNMNYYNNYNNNINSRIRELMMIHK